MADLTPSGSPVDELARKIKQRMFDYEIHGMRVTIEKYEIDIMNAENNIIRLQESIEATKIRITEKEVEKEKFNG